MVMMAATSWIIQVLPPEIPDSKRRYPSPKNLENPIPKPVQKDPTNRAIKFIFKSKGSVVKYS